MISIKKDNVLKDANFREKHNNSFFTKEGYDALFRFTNKLVKEYIIRKEYPFTIGIVLGIPLFDWSKTFKNKEDLLSRIKGYAQLLGIEEFNIVTGIEKYTLKLEVKND